MKWYSLFSSLCIAVLPVFSSAITPPVMQEDTTTSGITHSYEGGWEFFVGGGVAAFDCNQDSYPELYFAGGSKPSQLFLNTSELGKSLTFQKLSGPVNQSNVTGAYPIDINNDEILDLVLLRVGENLIYKGLGNCQFEPVNKSWGFEGGSAWTTAFSATWEDGLKFPTLAFGNYVDRDQPGAPFGTCHDTDFYRPDNLDQYGDRTPLTPGFCALSLLFTDWNRSGSQDLRIANDRQYYRNGYEQLWRIQKDILPTEYTQSDGWRHLKLWGMGIAATDLTNDGRPDYFITSMADNKLRTLSGRGPEPSFEDIAFERGVTAHRPFVGNSVLPSTAWHAQFDDVNNDSFSDLYVVKGNVEAMTDFAIEDPNNLLLGTPKGQFIEAAHHANLISLHKGRGGALVDLNLDGLLDVVVVNRQHNAQLWRNLGQNQKTGNAMGNWVALKIQQPDSNRFAVGAFIEVRTGNRTQTKEVTIGGGHAGQALTWHHFGLGVSERAQARVQWPDGSWGPWVRLFANQFARINKGSSTAEIWLPARKASPLRPATGFDAASFSPN